MPSSKSHNSSDGLLDFSSSNSTDEDSKKIEAVTAAWDGRVLDSDLNESFPSEIDGLDLNLLTEEDWAKLDDIEQSVLRERPLNRSLDSEADGINLGRLSEEELEKLDAFISESYAGGPSIPIVPEHSSSEVSRTQNVQSPLHQFRQQGILSVTDLSQPTWCEVQFDYGLRGKRSRPIGKRPATFKSSSGKLISIEQKVAQKNDVRTKQGLAIHKELQRELRAKELEVDITTKESQWALRIVNMMACLKEVLHGPRNMTREMPVFGILHDEVVVGIIDELVCELSIDHADRKRKAKDETSEGRPKKRSSMSKSPDVKSDGPIESNDGRPESGEPKCMYTLHLSDAKTRKRNSIPDDRDALGGRLQLYIYCTLLTNLVTLEPPFDFDFLWRKLDVNPDAKLPTRFLVQAQLISDDEAFGLISLNDLITSFYQLINDETMQISPILELVYYLRPSETWKGKRAERGVTENEPLALNPVAGRLPARNGAVSDVGTSRRPDMVQSEHLDDDFQARHDNVNEEEEEGIRRFPLIGKKTFVYDEQEMDMHVSLLLEWWRGERPPEGVPIQLTNRCRTCEYAKDCEWRDAKALELKNRSASQNTLLTWLHAS